VRSLGQYSAEEQSKDAICFILYLYRDRNHVERFFNRLKHCRRIATRYDKLEVNFFAFLKLAAIRL
jgi:transposase